MLLFTKVREFTCNDKECHNNTSYLTWQQRSTFRWLSLALLRKARWVFFVKHLEGSRMLQTSSEYTASSLSNIGLHFHCDAWNQSPGILLMTCEKASIVSIWLKSDDMLARQLKRCTWKTCMRHQLSVHIFERKLFPENQQMPTDNH